MNRALLLAALLCSAACRSFPDAPPEDAPLRAGDYGLTITHGGRERFYLLHLPPAVERGEPLPLVLDFHGGGGNARNQQEYSKLDALADREGFMVAYPEGTGPMDHRLLTWNAGSCCGAAHKQQTDDVGFVRAVVDDLAARAPLDRRRVYATGLSNGGMMSYRLAAEAPDLVAAVAPIAGMAAMDAPPRLDVPILHVHSQDDPRALYEGGLGPPFPLTDVRVTHRPVEETLAQWASANGCAPDAPSVERRVEGQGADAEHGAERLAWAGCRAPVVLWRLEGFGHVWPGGQRDFMTDTLGPGTSVIDANEELWRFFQAFARPAQK
jgi:polyhydroxybutyrate depolymerase